MRHSGHVVLAAAIALASATAMADKGGGGGGGHGGMGGGMGSMSSGSLNSGPGSLNSGRGGMLSSPATTMTPGTGSAASRASSTTGAANSGLPVGEGRITADAAHQRNLERARDRADDRNGVENENEVELQNRDRMENENEVELENRNEANDDAPRRPQRRHDGR
jgi:hypothetical protein